MQSLGKFLGKVIKTARQNVKMTQSELADNIGVDPKYISRIETGVSYPSLSVVEKIFKVLNINAKNIFDTSQTLSKTAMISNINANLKNASEQNLKIINDFVELVVQKED